MFALLPEATKNSCSENELMFRSFDSVQACTNDERISKHRFLGPFDLRICDNWDAHFVTHTTVFCNSME